jgi:hypothetical protein
MLLKIFQLSVLVCLSLLPVLAQEEASPSVRGRQLSWEFVLPSPAVSADVVDFGGAKMVCALATLHPDFLRKRTPSPCASGREQGG